MAAPREIEQYLHYFCGDAGDPRGLDNTGQLRIAFYKAVVTFVRAYAAIAQDLAEAGYSDVDIVQLQAEAASFTEILFNNLETIFTTPMAIPDQIQYPDAEPRARAELALQLDRAMREQAPADWKGDEAREAQVLNALCTEFPQICNQGL